MTIYKLVGAAGIEPASLAYQASAKTTQLRTHLSGTDCISIFRALTTKLYHNEIHSISMYFAVAEGIEPPSRH